MKDEDKSEEKYRALIDGMPDTVWVSDFDGKCIDINHAAIEMLGYSREELMSKGLAGIDPKMTSADTKALTGEILSVGPHVFETVHTAKDGRSIPVEIQSCVINYLGRDVVLSIGRDISKRKKAEEALRESEARYKSLFQYNHSVMLLIDLESADIVDANPAAIRYYGWSYEELTAKKITDINTLTRVQVFQEMKKARSEKRNHFVFQHRLSNGDIRHVEVYSGPIQVNGRDLLYSIIHDITDSKRAEEEREKLQAQLIQAQKMESIGTLAGGIAHNFNNVLMGIQGRASLLMADKDESHPDFDHLEGIEEYVRNAAGLTRDLLGFARGGKYEVKPTDLNALVLNETRMFGHTKKEIRIHEKYEENLWAGQVDRGQIRQALLNMYVNAWQAMPAGGDLYIQTENVFVEPEACGPLGLDPGKYVKISVMDTGSGMDKETQKRIFDPFFSTKHGDRATGLGLASTYGIVKNHGGFIRVYSEKGEGSTFNVYLPASEGNLVEKVPKEDAHGVRYGHGTVLLIDDETMIIDVGKAMLKGLGYRVLTSRSGEEALEIFTKFKDDIDLVILDMIMPGMDGGKTYTLLKKIDTGVPVLLSSGYSLNAQAKAIMDQGCNGFIQKPFSLKTLSSKIGAVLGKSR